MCAEADLPAKAYPTKAHARLSRSHEHDRRAQGAAGAPQEGAQAAHGVDRELGIGAGRLIHDVGIRRAQRLKQRREFAEVYRRGRAYRGQFVVLRALRRDQPVTRFGFAVGQAVGKAVVRNRVKRRLREAVRSLPVKAGWDLVLNARPGADQTDYRSLRAGVEELMSRARVLESSGEVGSR